MPPFYQWLSAIVGLVAFIIAFPTFFQQFFAQPKIGLSFSHDDSGNQGKVMKLHLMNLSINNWFLKTLNVTRLPDQDVYLAIRVFNAKNGEVVADTFMPYIELSPSDKSGRVSLTASMLAANVKLAKWQRSTNLAILIYGDRLIPLQEGTYIFTMSVGLGEKLQTTKPFLLHIGKTETDMVWDKDITDKILV